MIIGRLQDGNFFEEIFAGFATLSYSLDSQAELAMPLLPILDAVWILFVLVEEEKSLFWVEKPLARFTSRPWPMKYCQEEERQCFSLNLKQLRQVSIRVCEMSLLTSREQSQVSMMIVKHLARLEDARPLRNLAQTPDDCNNHNPSLVLIVNFIP